MICLFEIGDVVLDDNDDDGQEKNIRAISSGELKIECFRYPELKVKALISIFFSRITEPISTKLLGEGFQFS